MKYTHTVLVVCFLACASLGSTGPERFKAWEWATGRTQTRMDGPVFDPDGQVTYLVVEGMGAGEAAAAVNAVTDSEVDAWKAAVSAIPQTRRDYWTTLTNHVYKVFAVMPPYTAQQAALLEPLLINRASKARDDIASADPETTDGRQLLKDAMVRLSQVQAISTADARLRTFIDYDITTEHAKQP